MGRALLLFVFAAAAGADFQATQKKLAELQAGRAPAGITVTFTAQEINAYARRRAVDSTTGAVRDPKIQLNRNTAVGTASVDFLKLSQARGEAPGKLISWILQGERPVRVALRLQSGDGAARVDLDSVEISGLVIQGRALEFLIDRFIRPRYPDVAIGRSFELDHGVESVEIHPASVNVRIRK